MIIRMYFKKINKTTKEETFSIKIILAVVMTILLNSANQNLLKEISHLNYYCGPGWCIVFKKNCTLLNSRCSVVAVQVRKVAMSNV